MAMTWDDVKRRMDMLVASNAPALIRAHWMMAVGLPVLMKSIGVRECGLQLALIVSRQLALMSGTCVVCQQRDAVGVTEMCPRCGAEMDQMSAEVDDMLGDDDSGVP